LKENPTQAVFEESKHDAISATQEAVTSTQGKPLPDDPNKNSQKAKLPASIS